MSASRARLLPALKPASLSEIELGQLHQKLRKFNLEIYYEKLCLLVRPCPELTKKCRDFLVNQTFSAKGGRLQECHPKDLIEIMAIFFQSDLYNFRSFSYHAGRLDPASGSLWLDALSTSPTLIFLDLSFNPLGDKVSGPLASFIEKNAVLESLFLIEIGMSSRGFQRVVGALFENCALKTLNLEGNAIDEAAILYLCDSILTHGERRFKSLDLNLERNLIFSKPMLSFLSLLRRRESKFFDLTVVSESDNSEKVQLTESEVFGLETEVLPVAKPVPPRPTLVLPTIADRFSLVFQEARKQDEFGGRSLPRSEFLPSI
jgi:hypothetical protein